MLQHANANAFPFLSSFFYSGRRHSALTLLTPPGKVCREARKWRSSIEVCNPGWIHILKIHDVYTSLKKLTRRCKKEKFTKPDSSCSTVLLEPTKDSPTCLEKLNQFDEYWGFVEVRLFSRKPIFPAYIFSLIDVRFALGITRLSKSDLWGQMWCRKRIDFCWWCPLAASILIIAFNMSFSIARS